MTTKILINDLKVGDRLPDTEKINGYGYFFNRVVTEIRITKGGRYHITLSDQYRHENGDETQPRVNTYTNGPIVGTREITILK